MENNAQGIRGGTGALTDAQRVESVNIINEGVQERTLKDQKKAFLIWSDFIASFNGGVYSSNPYLNNEPRRDCTTVLALYVKHLRQNRTPIQIKRHLSKLRSNWTVTGIDISWMQPGSAEVKRIINSMPTTADEARDTLERSRTRTKFPITMEMSISARNEYWTTQLSRWTSADALDKMGAVLGMSLQAESVSRGTNWVGKKAILTQDIRFQVGRGEANDDGSYDTQEEVRGDKLSAVITLPAIPGETSLPVFDAMRVTCAHMDHLDTKPGHPVSDIRIARRSLEESAILDDMITWLVLASPQAGEPFLTRRGKHATRGGKTETLSRKIITGAMVANVMKNTAERLNLNPDLFSLMSLRKTGVTNMGKKGAGTEEINKRGGYKPGSTVARTHYDFSTASNGGRGTLVGPAAMPGEGWTNEDLANLVPSSRLRAAARTIPDKSVTTRKSAREKKKTHQEPTH